MSVAKNAIKFLQDQHEIDIYNVKKDLLLSRFEIFNLKNYIKQKNIQQMHNAITKKIKLQPSFIRKSVKLFLAMPRMEFHNLFLPNVDFRQFLHAKKSRFSCEISIAHATHYAYVSSLFDSIYKYYYFLHHSKYRAGFLP